MDSYLDKYKVTVPEGESGEWKVTKFTLDDAASDRTRWTAMRCPEGRGFVPPGTYTRLVRDETLVMSDTPDEVRDHKPAMLEGKGHCLVNGLGLGMVAQALLNDPNVTKVTAIERSPDVIKLVGPHLTELFGDRLEIVEADAFEYKPPKGVRYGMVWHDIWDTIDDENLPEMHKLHRKYGRKADWQGSWCQDICERQREETRMYEAMSSYRNSIL